MKKILSWTAVGIMSVGALAACGSDKKSPTTTKAPAVTTGDTSAGDNTATTAGSSGDSSAAIEEFCAKVTDLVAKGPTASDYATKLQELIASSQSLAAAAATDPTVQAKLEDCLKKLQPGG